MPIQLHFQQQVFRPGLPIHTFEYESHAHNTQSKATLYPSIETETMDVSGLNLDQIFCSQETLEQLQLRSFAPSPPWQLFDLLLLRLCLQPRLVRDQL